MLQVNKKKCSVEEWEESIIVPIYKNGDKTEWNDYRGIPLYVQTLIQHPAVKFNSTHTGDFWRSEWISTQQVSYWSYIL